MARSRKRAADGRALRGERSREAILRATYELVRVNEVPPTVAQVARRARVGTRTVFRQFADLESLYRSISERALQAVLPIVAAAPPPSGDLAVDLRALVSRRARVYEQIAPFRRAASLLRHQSTFLAEQGAAQARLFREALERVVGPHLRRGAGDALEAMDALLSFETWDRMRELQRLSGRRAQQVVFAAVWALAKQA